MAIEGFGQSLLSKQRERQKKQERKEIRTAALGLAGAVGIGLYRQNLKKKQENFLNSQGVRDLRIQYNQSQKVADDAFRVQDAITASGGDANKYYYKQAFDELKEEYKIKLGKDADDLKYLETGYWDADIAKKAKEIAADRAKAQADRLAFGQKFRASGTFEDALKRSSKRPDTVAGAIFNAIRRKSNQDINEDTLKALKESELGQIALPGAGGKTRASEVERLYRETGNWGGANELADLPQYIPETTISTTVTGSRNATTGEYEFIKTTKTTDIRTNREVGDTNVVKMKVNLSTTEERNKALLKNAVTTFNPYSRSKTMLNDRGYNEYQDRLKAADIPLIPKTLEEYNQQVQILQDVIRTREVVDSQGKTTAVDYTSEDDGFTKQQQALFQSETIQNEFALIEGQFQAADREPNEQKSIKMREEAQDAYMELMRRIATFGDID